MGSGVARPHRNSVRWSDALSYGDGVALPDDLTHDRWIRSNGYDPEWVIENQMGPNALWLLEWLTEALSIQPGDRVLDLGCGRAMTSIFLAREFGAEVTAADLWIPADENRARIEEAGLADHVTAVHAEAHQLPFEPESFDAIVSIDAYQYFGTADLYLAEMTRILGPDGRLGIVVPGMTNEIGEHPPPHLEPWWEWEFCCFHTPEWWRAHWAKTGLVRVDVADWLDEGWRDWVRFAAASAPFMEGWRVEATADEQAMLNADQGETLGFARVVASRT